MCHPSIQLNEIKATLIHPASDKHIEKFSTRKKILIEETPLIYEVSIYEVPEVSLWLRVIDCGGADRK